MSMQRTFRQVVDIAELKVRLQMAEQAVCAAKELLARLDTDLEQVRAEGSTEQVAATPGASTGHRLIPLTEWPKIHPWPPLGGLRHLVFNAAFNGFDSVIRRVGDRVLIDERAFFEWANQRAGSASALPEPTRGSQARRVRR